MVTRSVAVRSSMVLPTDIELQVGKPHSVRYEQVNAMLLNEFLKEHRKVQELEKEMAGLTAQLKVQAAQIQKVSTHLKLNESARKVVLNNQ